MSDSLQLVKDLLKNQLQLGDRVDSFDSDTPLLGALPEMDSMSVVNIITAIEEQTGVEIEDEEITAETFETVGNLARFIETKAG